MIDIFDMAFLVSIGVIAVGFLFLPGPPSSEDDEHFWRIK